MVLVNWKRVKSCIDFVVVLRAINAIGHQMPKFGERPTRNSQRDTATRVPIAKGAIRMRSNVMLVKRAKARQFYIGKPKAVVSAGT